MEICIISFERDTEVRLLNEKPASLRTGCEITASYQVSQIKFRLWRMYWPRIVGQINCHSHGEFQVRF